MRDYSLKPDSEPNALRCNQALALLAGLPHGGTTGDVAGHLGVSCRFARRVLVTLQVRGQVRREPGLRRPGVPGRRAWRWTAA